MGGQANCPANRTFSVCSKTVSPAGSDWCVGIYAEHAMAVLQRVAEWRNDRSRQMAVRPETAMRLKHCSRDAVGFESRSIATGTSWKWRVRTLH